MKTNLAYILATLSFVPTISAMEGQPTQPAPQKLTLQQIISSACAQTTPLTTAQINAYTSAVDQTVFFENLATTESPQVLKMCSTGIFEVSGQVSGILTKQYIEAWAPRVGLAALCCCFTSLAKKIFPGSLESVPSETATVMLTSAWTAQVMERHPQRQSIVNGNAVLTIIEQKNQNITKQRIAVIKHQQSLVAEMKARFNAQTQDAQATQTHIEIEEPQETTEETKKDK